MRTESWEGGTSTRISSARISVLDRDARGIRIANSLCRVTTTPRAAIVVVLVIPESPGRNHQARHCRRGMNTDAGFTRQLENKRRDVEDARGQPDNEDDAHQQGRARDIAS